MRKIRMSKRLQILCGGLFFAVMFVYLGVTTYSAYVDLSRGYDGWTAARRPVDRWVIISVDAEGPAAALRKDDVVFSINGVRPQDDPQVVNFAWQAPPGTAYPMVIEREGRLIEFTFNTVRRPFFKPFLMWVGVLAQKVIYPLIFLLPGFVVFLLKPGDKQALLLALMLGTYFAISNYALPSLPAWLLYVAVAARILGTLFWPVFFHFFLVFPERSPLLRRFPRLEFYLYLPYLLTILPFHAPNRYWNIFEPELAWRVIPPQSLLGTLNFIFIVLYVVAGVAALALNYWQASPAAKRKARVAVVGSGLGIIHMFLMLISEVTSLGRMSEFRMVSGVAGLLLLPLIPASFSYAIVRHQVIPVSLIIRRGVRYMLVSRGAVLLDMIAVGLSVTTVLTYVFNRTRPPGIVIGLVSAAVGIITWKVASRLHDKYLAPLIDRRFFRQSYDAHQIVAELTQSLRTVKDLPQLLELVAMKIQSALQTENVTVFLRDRELGRYQTAYSCDYSEAHGRAVTRQRDGQMMKLAGVIERASDNGHPVAVELEEVLSDGGGGDEMTAAELEVLKEVKAALLMPLVSKEVTLGIISLGPRLGDLPFSRDDKRLLTSVSGPATFAIENARLVEQMIAEARRLQEIEVDHRRKTEELAYARQLQLSMLPKRDLSFDQIEIIGQMRTATEVGGDYYDFIEMANGRVCIAVGDATGHGMAAGLVVGMVKMGLINGLQQLNDHTSVKLLIEDLNRALKRSLSQRGMGMCLGAAILDVSTLKAEVISNGMPAPYHYRAANHSLSPVVTQAPPLGFLRQVNVRPVEAQLQPGDALVWLSDGFEERLDRQGQVWGDEQVALRLERICVEESRAEGIARRMIEACDSAAGGRVNDDDMTIVVAKVKAG
jgi:sigma-B regulation protein RsbU (phosphoserine phosphatase)